MKKALLFLLLIVVVLATVVFVASWFRAPEAVATSAARPWPGGMGTLDSVADPLPPQHENEAAKKLRKLAGPVAENEAITNYLQQEIARGELTIGEPPALPNVSALR